MRMAEWREALRKAKTAKERTSTPRVKMPELAADYRVTCNEEVNQGLTIEMAMAEASRCLDCANPQCVTGCPVGIDIPGFIKNVERGEFAEAARVIKKTSALPAVCGRVCPQEKQCESRCIHTKMKHEAVAIGYLERFVADWARSHGSADEEKPAANGIKVAVVGSGPAGLAFAGDMAKRGYSVTVYEALHEIGWCADCLEVEKPQQGDFCIVRIREGALAGCGQLFQDEEVVGVPYIYGIDLADVLADELDYTQVAERCGCIVSGRPVVRGCFSL